MKQSSSIIFLIIVLVVINSCKSSEKIEKGDVGYLDSLLKQNDHIHYWIFPELQ